MESKFKVDDQVKWRSQSRGFSHVKEGVIAAVIPAGVRVGFMPWSKKNTFDLNQFNGHKLMFDIGSSRNHVSYLVEVEHLNKQGIPVRPRLYWPRVDHLEHVKDKES